MYCYICRLLVKTFLIAMHSEATGVYILSLQTLKWQLAKFQTGPKFCDPPEEVEGFVLQH